MTAFEPQTSGIGSGRSANWATTPDQTRNCSLLQQQGINHHYRFVSLCFMLENSFLPKKFSQLFSVKKQLM